MLKILKRVKNKLKNEEMSILGCKAELSSERNRLQGRRPSSVSNVLGSEAEGRAL
jgi:hypothetical protein